MCHNGVRSLSEIKRYIVRNWSESNQKFAWNLLNVSYVVQCYIWLGFNQKLVRSFSEIGQKLVRNWSEVGQKLVRNWSVQSVPEVGQKLSRNWSEVGQKLVRSRSEICQKLVRSWSEVGQKLVRSWSEVFRGVPEAD